jgi:hypothetical protein
MLLHVSVVVTTKHPEFDNATMFKSTRGLDRFGLIGPVHPSLAEKMKQVNNHAMTCHDVVA